MKSYCWLRSRSRSGLLRYYRSSLASFHRPGLNVWWLTFIFETVNGCRCRGAANSHNLTVQSSTGRGEIWIIMEIKSHVKYRILYAMVQWRVHFIEWQKILYYVITVYNAGVFTGAWKVLKKSYIFHVRLGRNTILMQSALCACCCEKVLLVRRVAFCRPCMGCRSADSDLFSLRLLLFGNECSLPHPMCGWDANMDSWL